MYREIGRTDKGDGAKIPIIKKHDQSSSEIIKFSNENRHEQILSWRGLRWQLPPEKR